MRQWQRWVTRYAGPFSLVEHRLLNGLVGSFAIGFSVAVTYAIASFGIVTLESAFIFPLGVTAWLCTKSWSLAVYVLIVTARWLLIPNFPIGLIASFAGLLITRGMAYYMIETWTQRERVLFFRRAAHELRAPVTVINGYSSMLATLPPDLQGNAAGRIIEQVDLLNNIIDKFAAGRAAWDDTDPDYQVVDRVTYL